MSLLSLVDPRWVIRETNVEVIAVFSVIFEHARGAGISLAIEKTYWNEFDSLKPRHLSLEYHATMKVDYQKRLLPVIRFLEANFNEPLNLVEVAALANLSPYHFHRMFKAVQQETLADFIRRLRLEAAAEELFKTKPPVLNVALDYGFS